MHWKFQTPLPHDIFASAEVNERWRAAAEFGTKSLRIGSIEFPCRLFAAPLAGITTFSTRQLLRSLGNVILFTEMIPVHLAVFNKEKLLELFNPAIENDPFLIVQISGAHSDILERAIGIMRDMGVRTINLNMGCPSRKVTSSGAGANLLRSMGTTASLFQILCREKMVVTAKIRSGWDEHSINAPEVGRMLEDLGVQAIFLHPRTAKDTYAVPAQWERVAELKSKIRIPVIGNGDIFKAEDGLRRLDPNVCDGVMIGRAILGNPWIFSEIASYTHKNSVTRSDRNISQWKRKADTMINHLRIHCAEQGEVRGVPSFRKFGVRYLTGIPSIKPIREEYVHLGSVAEIEKLLHSFNPELSELSN